MIQVRNLSKRYGDKKAVDNLTFDVQPGRVTGFLGPNGAGKSTTMRMILGLDHPTSGNALISGKPYASFTSPLTKVGALIDSSPRNNRTARNHLLCIASSANISKQRVAEVLELVGISDAANRPVREFSLGMGQRLGLATAFLGDPQVLILDEPTNGLDPEGIQWMRTFLTELAAEGRTVFLSSHLLSEMERVAHHLIVINHGRLVADVPAHDFISTHASLEDAYTAITQGTGENQ